MFGSVERQETEGKCFFFFLIDIYCLQCAHFYCTAKLFRYIYIFIHYIFHYDSSQDIKYSSLCYTLGPCCFLNRLNLNELFMGGEWRLLL